MTRLVRILFAFVLLALFATSPARADGQPIANAPHDAPLILEPAGVKSPRFGPT